MRKLLFLLIPLIASCHLEPDNVTGKVKAVGFIPVHTIGYYVVIKDSAGIEHNFNISPDESGKYQVGQTITIEKSKIVFN